ncbi:hypothetical protein D3C76_1665190 [compost metagenome]
MQHRQCFFRLAHDEVFGDFQLQETGFEAVVLEQLLDAAEQVRLAQLRTGEVDRQRAEAFVGFVPLVHLPAGGLQYPVADLQDHAVFFRQ